MIPRLREGLFVMEWWVRVPVLIRAVIIVILAVAAIAFLDLFQ